MLSFVVTTALSGGDAEIREAGRLGMVLGAPYVPRAGRSLRAIRAAHNVDGVLVAGRERAALFTAGGEFFFHPGMAMPRIKALAAGKTDQMVQAMALRRGAQVLDCTLGLAADALTAAYAVGETGAVVGLEVVRPVAVLVRDGLAALRAGAEPRLAAAAARVRVVQADYRAYLAGLPDNSFDVVYFDPMFGRGVADSSGMRPLRALADPSPVDRGAIAQACRVAAQRVVLKERRGSPEFERLGLTEVMGGRYAAVAYGIRRTGGDTV